MKKRILSVFLVLTMCLTLMPVTAAATDPTAYAITNGTPESAKETNHGYITVDKTSAAENDTVTVTVNPADGYQLKSLTVTPVAPTEYTVAFDLNGITGTAPMSQTIKDGEKVTKPADPTDTVHTFAGWYKTKNDTTGALSDPWNFDTDTVTADMTLYAQWTRTLESIYNTNSDIPKATDNTAPNNAWVNADGGKAFIAYSTGNTVLMLKNTKTLSCRKTENFTRISDDKYVFEYVNGSTSYGVFTLNIKNSTLVSIEYNGAGTSYAELSGTYSPQSQCIAAGTMISMPEGRQKAVEELEIGDVICTFDHETGEVSSASIAFIWESKNVGNAFTLTFKDDIDDIDVTVIEEHGFYDQEKQKYVFINLQNAEEYIGDHFYNADTNSWLELKSCKALNDSVDAYAIITSGHLNHMSNGMLSMCDGSVKVLANIFEYDDQMKFDADRKQADIKTYGLTPKEKIMELEGFIESDYDDYNLQYLNVAIGKGLTTWEWIEAFSDYCVENGLVDIYSGSETAEENEAPRMLLMSKTAPKTLLGSALKSTPQDGIKITEKEDGTYQFTMPAKAVTVTAEFEKVPKTTVTITAMADGFTYGETGKIGYKNVGVTDHSELVDSLVATYYRESATAGQYETTGSTEVPKNTGNYKVTLSVPKENANYTGSTDVTFTIAKRPVTLVADSAKKTYDGEPLTCTTFTVKEDTETANYGFVGEEGINSVTMTKGSIITDAGRVDNVIDSKYPKDGTNLDNYNISTENGTLEILKASQEAPKKGEKYALSGSTLTAESGYELFDGTNTRSSFTIDASKTYSIRKVGDANHFASPYTAIDTTVTVNVLAVPSSMGTVSGSGSYAIGSNVTLTASPRSGYEFVEWQDLSGAQKSTNAKYTIPSITTGQTLIAAFKPVNKTVVTIPTITNTPYAGTEITGVAESAYYTLSGTAKATAAGQYTVTATLNDANAVWSDGTTAPKTLVWNIFKKSPETAPTGLSATENSITGVDNTMEYMKMGGSSYTGVTDTTISDLAAGTYYVRYKETTNYYASPATIVVVRKPTLNVVTLQPSNLTSTGATFNGVFAPYSDGETYTTKFLLNGTAHNGMPTTSTDTFTLAVSNLTPDTDYTVTAVVNDTKGNTVTFHTPAAAAPVVVNDGRIKVNVTAEGGSSKFIISVERGNDVIASWASDNASGDSATANFDNLPYGNYNVVVRTNNGHYTETKMLSVAADNKEVTVNFMIPVGKLATVVDVKTKETPKTAVDGLSEILSADDKKDAAVGSKDVEVKLEVEKKDEDTTDTAQSQIKKLLTANTSESVTVDFIDMSLIKTTTELDASGNATSIDTQNIGATNNTVIEIAVPYDSSSGAPMVLRYHNGMAEELTKLSARPTAPYVDGTYFVDSGYVFIYASGFSTYAIGYEPQSTYSGGGASSYAVTVESAKNGTVSADKKSTYSGNTVTITVAPEKGFTLETLTVLDKNGKEIEVKNLGNNKYSFKMPNGKVTVSATFMEDNTMLNFFVDVKATDYYYDAVLWAAESGITNGVDAVHFGSKAPVTRGQVVTFLWRAAGCPEAEHTAAVFKDVSPDAYYVKAVEWALSEGITKGTSDTTFSPDMVCTRGQIVTFLARFAGVADEATGYKHGFTDVKATDYFNNAVAWAKDNKVTEGTSATTFSPNTDCTRAQVVTFLYRWMVK